VKVTSRRFALVLFAVAAGCPPKGPETTEIRRFALNSLDGLRSTQGVEYDSLTSTDGGGSVKIAADGLTTVRLFEVAPAESLEDTLLLYRASVRTQGLDGDALLEMWVRVEGKGEFFSKGFDQTVSGDTNWTSLQIPFVLKPGQRADLVKLNLVVRGTGTVWIDDVRLLRAPLPEPAGA